MKRRTFRLRSVFLAAEQGDGVLFSLTLAILVFGWVILYSASAVLAEAKFGDQYFFLKKQVLWSAVGLAAMLAASRIKLAWVQRLARPSFFACLGLLILVLVAGHEVMGAKRWLRFGCVGLQPSEFAKLGMVLFLADALDRKKSRLTDFRRGFLPLMAVAGAAAGLILLEKDLGTAFLLFVVAAGMIYLAGARASHLAVTVLAAVPFLYLAVFHVAYRKQRLLSFLNPWGDAQGAGYQLVQSMMAIGSGGFWGKGSGESTIKLLYLPEAQTDFIFSILGEEFGFVGAAILSGLFLCMVHRCMKAARGATRWFDALLAGGVGLWLGGQVVVNLAVVTGLMPTKGMPLPLVSFGGSSMVVILAAVGLVLNVSRRRGTPVSGGRT
jgi:cell division protein FtsW